MTLFMRIDFNIFYLYISLIYAMVGLLIINANKTNKQLTTYRKNNILEFHYFL